MKNESKNAMYSWQNARAKFVFSLIKRINLKNRGFLNSLYLLLLCTLPLGAIFFYLTRSLTEAVLSLIIVLFINLFLVWLFHLNKAARTAAFSFKLIETIFSFLIIKTKGPFNLFYVWKNIDTVPDIILSHSLPKIIGFFGLLFIVGFFYLYIFKKTNLNLTTRTIVLPILALMILQNTGGKYVFLDKIVIDPPKLKKYYPAFSNPLIEKNQNIVFDKEENIVLLHLESWNSKVVNGDVLIDGKHYTKPMAPVFLSHAEKGLYFPEFYGNSMQTIRSEENTLCGIANNMSDPYSYRNDDYYFKCLPEIFSENGFKTYFFKAGDIDFHKTGYFMKKIGFDKTLNKEIMKEGDEKYIQFVRFAGYRDDIFYQRVFDFLEKEPAQKKFVYIAVSALLHYPFYTCPELDFVDEFEKPKNLYERFSNCLRQEDYALKKFFEYYNKTFPKNTHLFILGDTSWPVGINKNNKYSHVKAYDDNFLVSFLYVPPPKSDIEPKVIKKRYDQISLFHTIVELFSNHYQSNKSIPEITSNDFNDGPRFIRLNQPFGKSVGVVKYPDKWIYSLKNNTVIYFNLEGDRFEQNPTEIGKFENLEEFFNYLIKQ